MIMSSYKVIAFSNRKLCNRTLIEQIDRFIKLKKTDMFVLREKDLSEEEYEVLAREVIKKCKENNIECILHNYVDVAIRLKHYKIHLPLTVFKSNKEKIKCFEKVGVSTHSIEEAKFAELNGASYITVGHIFKTDCKRGVKPRGLKFLNQVCNSVSIPVYAIGGINKDNEKQTIEEGASGICMMSEFMKI
ncbi:MAG: thiamine phosphate synthase [Clostridium sp.]|nr:thiamine phosphate synthase [Clostridium sp.]